MGHVKIILHIASIFMQVSWESWKEKKREGLGKGRGEKR